MTAAPLLRELWQAAIVLSAHGGRLHVEAPIGVVTPGLRQHIVEHKAALLAELHQFDTRAALLALADRLDIDRSTVARIPSADLLRWASVPAGALLAYLRGLDAAATRQAGKVPVGDTAAIHCTHCGPVYVHPGIAAVLPVVAGWPLTLGCPWCHVRKAGGIIPRPA